LASDQGNARAQFGYGVLLDDGNGIPFDMSLATHYSKLAADQGHADVRRLYEMLTRGELFWLSQ
jgi:TPR repeat protein